MAIRYHLAGKNLNEPDIKLYTWTLAIEIGSRLLLKLVSLIYVLVDVLHLHVYATMMLATLLFIMSASDIFYK